MTAISTTAPSRRARPASGGYCGRTSWIRLASTTREATRILFTGVVSGDFAGTATFGALFSIALKVPPPNAPTAPPETPPTTPPVGPTGATGASWVVCIGAEMVLLVGTYVDTDIGARSFVTLPAAAAGGCRYNIVTVSRLGSGSVRYSGATTRVTRTSAWKATAPTAAHRLRGRKFPDTMRL